jgi:hypothetical protein
MVSAPYSLVVDWTAVTSQTSLDDLLRQIAPLFAEVAEYAQRAAAELEETEWAKKHLKRSASLHQVSGTARWRIGADELARRQAELPDGVEFKTTDADHNRGRYIAAAPEVLAVFTVRRVPHRDDEQPDFLQFRMEEIREQAPVEIPDDAIGVVYLGIPPLGKEPTIGIVLRGKEPEIRPISEYLDRGEDFDVDGPQDIGGPSGSTPGPIVGSELDVEEADEGDASPADG